MSHLTTERRNALPDSAFAGPGRSYPIEDAAHARNALARVSQFGSPAEKAEVRRKVHARYPGIEVSSLRSEGAEKVAKAMAGGRKSK